MLLCHETRIVKFAQMICTEVISASTAAAGVQGGVSINLSLIKDGGRVALQALGIR